MKQKLLYKNVHFVLSLTAIATNLLLFIVFVYINTGKLLPDNLTGKEFWRENWLILLQFYAITYFVYYSITHFNIRYKAKPNGARRFVKEILFIGIAGFFLQEIFRTIFINVIVVPEDPSTLNVKLRMLQMVNVAAILIQYSFMTSMRIYRYLQQKQVNLVRLQKEYTLSQFEALKNQLNPHFLFNSLSILSSLVYADANAAEEFIAKLSKTYRYLLDERDKDTVHISREIEFLEAYVYLLSQRFGKKIHINFYNNHISGKLIPHSLLIAMEYIVSNNVMSTNKPLIINIDTNKHGLTITYNAQAKTSIEQDSLLQLEHLQKRYMGINNAFHLLPVQKNDKTVIELPFL